MKRLAGWGALLLGLQSSSAAYAVDHNNIDASRPLDFDDATAVAYHEQDVEFGASLGKPSHGVGADGSVEYLYGFAPNTHLSLDFNPAYASSATQNNGHHFDAGNLGVGVFHNFNREYGHTPAFGARIDAYLPTGRDANGVNLRLRAIASRQFRQYDQLHLNLDLRLNNGDEGTRRLQPGVILGYSHPLGFPTSFDKTLVAQVGYSSRAPGGDARDTFNIGLGIRQQVGPRNVLDYGLTSDLSGGSDHQPIRLVVGYSTQF